jgi:hypothetical protein
MLLASEDEERELFRIAEAESRAEALQQEVLGLRSAAAESQASHQARPPISVLKFSLVEARRFCTPEGGA